MTIRLWCAPGIFLVRVHEDIVVLDVTSDRYDCLLDAAEDIVLGDDGALLVSDPDLADDLKATGLARSDGQEPAVRRAAPARRELACTSRVSLPSVVHAGLGLARGTALFRGRTLAQLVSTPVAPSRPLDPLRLDRSVQAARSAQPWVPFEGECLQRAFQLKHLLARRGIATDWVFGVRTWPFAAHCWLQIGDLVVADSLERVRRYSPIMVA